MAKAAPSNNDLSRCATEMEELDQIQSEPPNVDSIERPKRLPPISILDLLVVTTALAFAFMIMGRLNKIAAQSPLSPYADLAFWDVWRMMSSVLPGITFAGIYWIVKQKQTTGKFLWQPGHWILAAYAVLQVVQFTTGLVMNYIFGGSSFPGDSGWLTLFFLLQLLANLTAVVILLVAPFRCPVQWRWVLATAALTLFIDGLLYANNLQIIPPSAFFRVTIMYGIYAVGIPCILLLIVAAIIDVMQKTQRDWLHWIGVLVLFLAFIDHPMVRYHLFDFLKAQSFFSTDCIFSQPSNVFC